MNPNSDSDMVNRFSAEQSARFCSRNCTVCVCILSAIQVGYELSSLSWARRGYVPHWEHRKWEPRFSREGVSRFLECLQPARWPWRLATPIPSMTGRRVGEKVGQPAVDVGILGPDSGIKA